MAISEQLTGLLWLNEASIVTKVIAFFLTWVAVWLPFAIVIAIVSKWRILTPLSTQQKLPLLASLYLIAPLIIWGAADLEQVSFANYGMIAHPSTILHIGLGLAIGVLSLAVLFFLQQLLGWIKICRPASQLQKISANQQTLSHFFQIASVVLPAFVLSLWISATEELVFRGFLFNLLQQDTSIWLAAIISSAIFALLHLIWEFKETVTQLPGLWLMGMVLVLARFVDQGSLGLAIGLHAGWVWGIMSLDSLGMITYPGTVSPWLTGIAGKPLAGVAGIFLLGGTGVVLGWVGGVWR